MRGETLVNIRRAELADLDAITEIYNEAIRKTTATFDIKAKTREQQGRWFEAHGPRYPVIVAEMDERVVGWACLTPWSHREGYHNTAETSFYVKEERRGQGVGRRLKQAIIEEAHQIGHHALIALVAEGSEESLHLNESHGFVLVGTLKEVGRKFGRFLNVHIMQKILD